MTFSLKHGIYAHPFEMVACISTFLSVYGAFQLLLYHPDVIANAEAGILTCPRWMLWAWVIMGVVGAIMTAAGLTTSIFSQKGRTIEEQGLWLMGAMWLSAGFARALLDWNAWIEYVRYFSIAAGCIGRLMQINDFHEFVKRSWREDQPT